jgi:hypothetical protein
MLTRKGVLKIISSSILILILIFGYFVYNIFTQFKKLNQGELSSTIDLDTIPFTYSSSGHIVVQVKVQGSKKSYPFILDSGAPTYFFNNHTEEFDLSSNGWSIGKGSSGNWFFSGIKKIRSLSIGNYTFKNLNAETIYNNFGCSDQIYGLIGIGVMKHLVWQIDFKNNLIIASKRLEDVELSENKIEIPLTENRYGHHLHASIKMHVSKFKKSVLIDLGSNGTLGIKEDHILEDSLGLHPKILDGIASEGLGGSNPSEQKEKLFLLDTLYFGTSQFTPINVPIDTSPEGLNMLGLGFLKNYRTTLSWSDKILILEPYDSIQTYLWNTFGFSLKFDDDLNKVVVKGIYRETSASISGLPLNAEVISINDYLFTNEASLCSYRSLKLKKDTVLLKAKYKGVISEHHLIRQPVFSTID